MPMPAPSDLLLRVANDNALPLWLVAEGNLEEWLATQPAASVRWIQGSGFKGERHRCLLLPGSDGAAAGAVLGLGKLTGPADLSLWHTAGLADKLPAGLDFRCATPLPPPSATQVALGFLYGHYRFDRYRRSTSSSRAARLVVPAGADADYAERASRAMALARDLVNTPAGDMGPAELASAAQTLAERSSARCRVIEGAALLEQKYPLVHAVGRASARAPRLIDLTWGDESHPLVALVGKGVCFDSGGLDLKPAVSMALMKKDMGGAATAMGLADLVMGLGLDVRLRVLVPAVENAISAPAMRPGDILRSHKGLTVEVNNTDAEGRLVLGDALALADEETPELVVSLATLTGAARVALGPDVPPFFTDDEA
ncbi:MAG TPA: leucyl aminopeptidase family protein, partial [Steroidobacteraceae bacterium]|nr:leucyl aminopeptidase family protein [Steroidobacteraceae bacterium]